MEARSEIGEASQLRDCLGDLKLNSNLLKHPTCDSPEHVHQARGLDDYNTYQTPNYII